MRRRTALPAPDRAGAVRRSGTSGARVRRSTTGTGAGQWGSARAFACAAFELECEIWQVRASYDGKPYRKSMMEAYGATLHPSPSEVTESGRKVLADDPDSPGSLGIAISEAVEVAAQQPETRYSLGSVLNHVLMHQTVIGEEALLQLAKLGERVDVMFGCTGGGSNFGGLATPSATTSCPTRSTPGGCATTACRRCCPTCTSWG